MYSPYKNCVPIMVARSLMAIYSMQSVLPILIGSRSKESLSYKHGLALEGKAVAADPVFRYAAIHQSPGVVLVFYL